MIYLFEIHLLACVLFLSGKDADSYQLKDRTDGPLTAGRVKRWHADGVALYVLNILPLIGWDPHDWLKTLAAALLIRLSVFDLAFNHWAGLPTTALGGTAITDKFFVRIYGQHGAVLKSLTFFVLTIIGNLLNIFL
jgi:hypothetical protein